MTSWAERRAEAVIRTQPDADVLLQMLGLVPTPSGIGYGWVRPGVPRKRPFRERRPEAVCGTHAKYTLGCRCPECREAKRVYMLELYHRKNPGARRLPPRTPAKHGERRTYNRGCRCEPCRDANRLYVRERYARRAA